MHFRDFLGGSCGNRTCWAGLGLGYLSNEGGVVVVAKVDGEDIVGELFGFLDDEAFAIFGPTYNIIVFVVLEWGGKYL